MIGNDRAAAQDHFRDVPYPLTISVCPTIRLVEHCAKEAAPARLPGDARTFMESMRNEQPGEASGFAARPWPLADVNGW